MILNILLTREEGHSKLDAISIDLSLAENVNVEWRNIHQFDFIKFILWSKFFVNRESTFTSFLGLSTCLSISGEQYSEITVNVESIVLKSRKLLITLISVNWWIFISGFSSFLRHYGYIILLCLTIFRWHSWTILWSAAAFRVWWIPTRE